jgi:2-iminobutanoate/2-iminopropanoate deaminase
MDLEYSNPATIASPDGQFSQAVVVPSGSRLLFISGQVPRSRDGSTVGHGDMTAQAEQVFSSLGLILEAHGASFSDVVKATIFVTDIAQAEAVCEVRSRHYGAAAPASTFVEVSALGDPSWLLEVEIVACLA